MTPIAILMICQSLYGRFLPKKRASGNEELYYISMLITITGYTEKEVEWRAREMAKLLNSQDIGTQNVHSLKKRHFYRPFHF